MSVEEIVLRNIANVAILYIVVVLGIFLIWWRFALSPQKLPGARSVFFVFASLEIVALLGLVLNWLPILGVSIPELLEQALRAAVWVVLVASAVTNMAIVMFVAWWRNEEPEAILARHWAKQKR